MDPPTTPHLRVKDPKKVAAGLRLVQKNKEAREALAREQAREPNIASQHETAASQHDTDSTTARESSWSVNTLLGISGMVIGVVGLYLQYRSQSQPSVVPTVKPVASRLHVAPQQANTIGELPPQTSQPARSPPMV